MDGSKTPMDAMSILMGHRNKKVVNIVDETQEIVEPKSNVNIANLLTGYAKCGPQVPQQESQNVQIDTEIIQERIETGEKSAKLNSTSLLLSRGKFNSKPPKPKMIVKLKVRNLEQALVKKKHIVCLKVDKEKLRQLVTPKPKIKANESAHPFFQAITSKMQNANANKSKRETKENTMSFLLKEPQLKWSEFIYKSLPSLDHEMLNALYNNHTNIPLQERKKPRIQEIYQPKVSEFIQFYKSQLEKSVIASAKPVEYRCELFQGDFDSLREHKYKNLDDKRYKRLTGPRFENNNQNLWCDLYKPLKSSHILQNPSVTKDLHNWIEDAFTKLTKVDQKKRMKMLKGRKKKANPLDDFIIMDGIAFDDANEEPDSFFVPSLIIVGPSGCGKTSAVHAIITEHHGGHVFELNSSQSRAKKDIEFHLKQIGTTSTIDTIENSVILFDDVELIDEEEIDKDFWQGVLGLLTYSYRPIIFTTNDIDAIPANIVEQSTVLRFSNQSSRTKLEYIDLMAMNQKIHLMPTVLKSLSAFDLRRSIMELQMIRNFVDHDNPIILSATDEKPSSFNVSSKLSCDELEQHSLKLELATLNEIPGSLYPNKYTRHFENCVEFYSSKLVNNRNRIRFDGNFYEDFINRNINSLFLRLPRSQVATDILPMIKSMANVEAKKLKIREAFDKQFTENKVEYLTAALPIIPQRKFGYDPHDIFGDL